MFVAALYTAAALCGSAAALLLVLVILHGGAGALAEALAPLFRIRVDHDTTEEFVMFDLDEED